MLYTLIDDLLTPYEIDTMLAYACLIIPAMKRTGAKTFYSLNVQRSFPDASVDFCNLTAWLITEFVAK